MTNEPVDSASKKKEGTRHSYNIIAMSQHTPRLNHW